MLKLFNTIIMRGFFFSSLMPPRRLNHTLAVPVRAHSRDQLTPTTPLPFSSWKTPWHFHSTNSPVAVTTRLDIISWNYFILWKWWYENEKILLALPLFHSNFHFFSYFPSASFYISFSLNKGQQPLYQQLSSTVNG